MHAELQEEMRRAFVAWAVGRFRQFVAELVAIDADEAGGREADA